MPNNRPYIISHRFVVNFNCSSSSIFISVNYISIVSQTQKEWPLCKHRRRWESKVLVIAGPWMTLLHAACCSCLITISQKCSPASQVPVDHCHNANQNIKVACALWHWSKVETTLIWLCARVKDQIILVSTVKYFELANIYASLGVTARFGDDNGCVNWNYPMITQTEGKVWVTRSVATIFSKKKFKL